MKVAIDCCLPQDKQKILRFPVKPLTAKLIVFSGNAIVVGADDGEGNFLLQLSAKPFIKNCRINYSSGILYYDSLIDFDIEYEEEIPTRAGRISRKGRVFRCRCCGAPSQITVCSKCGHIPEDEDKER